MRKLAWEKPCGGGLTHKALQRYPFLAEASESSKSLTSRYSCTLNLVEHCELISPSGKRVRFRLQHPVAIFSRLALNGLLLERARRAGADASYRSASRASNERNRSERLAAGHAAANIGRLT